MTASHEDEKLADLIDRFGHAGYGAWWLVAEIVAARIDSDGKAEVTYPLSKWSHLMSVRGSLVISTLSKLEVTHLVTVERTETDITVRIPNLLKYRDEYTRRSGQSPESVPTKEQKQKQKQRTEAEAEQKSVPAPLPPLTSISEWPLTRDVIRNRDPAVDDLFVRRLAQETAQHLISAGDMGEWDDEDLARAVQESYSTYHGRNGHGTGLLLNRVPRIIQNWGEKHG